jgi:hypothetical protein
MHPAIPIGPSEKGKERKYEDYYPKSVSGLGGLSLSGAGSSHVFRKDLSQTIVPLIVNPTTLTAEVTGKVNVPDEAFPTISTVPGAMISFRYFIEVILDIQGKLSSQDRNLGNLGGLASTIAQGADPDPLDRRYGSPVIDTSAVRRNMGVVACTFEVIVGTRDSARRKGKQKADPSKIHEAEAGAGAELETEAQDEVTPHAGVYGNGDYWYDETNGYDQHYYDPNYNGYNDYPAEEGYFSNASYTMPPPIPMPPIEDDSQLTEKERIRRAEARLLPSMPPGADQPGSSREAAALGATAPYLDEHQQNGYPRGTDSSMPVLLTPPEHQAGPSNGTSVFLPFAEPTHLPPTPSYEPRNIPLPVTPIYEHPNALPLSYGPPSPLYEPPNSSTPTPNDVHPSDDKRELQRRQLEAEASAPPADDLDANASGPAPRDYDDQPTAPVLSETEEAMLGVIARPPLSTDHSGGHHTEAGASAPTDADLDLPRYER